MSAATIAVASDLERYMLDLVNEERASRGLNALVLDKTLNASADAHSLWMLDNNVFSHTGVGNSTPTARMEDAGFDFSGSWRTAENIAAQSERGEPGLFDDVYDLHLALMNSPGHRENILMPDLEVVGIGIQTGNFVYESGTYYSVMVTQNFARTGGQTTPDFGPDETGGPSNDDGNPDPSNVLVGTATAENLIGTAQDDTITGSGGNDILSGEGGFDTAVYMGDASDYAITISNGSIMIEDRTGGDGTDTLNSIEALEFDDSTFALSLFTNVSSLTDADMLAFCELYVAYFNRAPDSAGLLFWGSRLADGMSMEDIAREFFDQPETRALYGTSTDNGAFVTAVYSNVLGRAPDGAGYSYWVNILDSGAVEQSAFILAMLDGAKAATGSAADAQYLETKAEIGAYYAVVNGLNNVSVANTAMQAFDGSNGSVSVAKGIIDSHAATIDSAQGSEFTISVTGLVEDALDWI
ncbi:DUF4214 domain-containing protein [Marivita hallyeonensis]|uniref:Cysteine-rich secretory protein family protein n=1 Tax=Marivita hallyeonensis TaxID=996342 RepID=A0A1M5UGD3_9RHOB|nr:DUF4214 domain-containing protein [Marivita hallyeonensis]SHH62001.1 protein of unknown function [Marivita hallyeonensis]